MSSRPKGEISSISLDRLIQPCNLNEYPVSGDLSHSFEMTWFFCRGDTEDTEDTEGYLFVISTEGRDLLNLAGLHNSTV